MRAAWLVVLTVVACTGKQAPPPPVSSIDRSCAVDADCTLADDSCCHGCGDREGAPVNAKAWAQVVSKQRDRCKDVQCPDYNCVKLPDCREVGVAVCKAGRCEKEPRPTEACAQRGGTP